MHPEFECLPGAFYNPGAIDCRSGCLAKGMFGLRQADAAIRVPGTPDIPVPYPGGSMLHELKALIGSHVSAADGTIGHIRTFLFDDRTWVIHYLVVEVGGWLKRKEVVLAVAALEQPDWKNRTFRVRLTKQQVHDSPDVDTEKPVSLQQEIAMREYFGRLASWVDEECGTSSVPTGVKYPVHTKEDPHLRSSWDMLGYEVWATDGDIGRLEGFVLDETSWHLGYLDVKAGGWLQDRSMLMPTRWVRSVSWADHRIYLHHASQSTEMQEQLSSR